MPIDKKLKLITYPDIRYELCNVKTLNLLPNVLASQRAFEKGCDEVAFHRNGTVTECAHNNISILKDGVFRTHPLTNHILPGTTRRHLIQHCGELGIPVDETAFTVDELFAADEVIVTSIGSLCNPVSEIDSKPVGGKAPELLKKLQTAYWERMIKETA
jgi:D-alanine transaminase